MRKFEDPARPQPYRRNSSCLMSLTHASNLDDAPY